MLYFTSDTHFGHSNICLYDNRGFSSIREHDEALIYNWNRVVTPSDSVYHLGDVVLSSPGYAQSILSCLNGKIYLIKGNHDKRGLRGSLKDRFEWIKDLEVISGKYDGESYYITLCHYAMRTWYKSHWGTYHLYGHSHGRLYDDPKLLSFDVGVVSNNYTPLSLKEVLNRLKRKKEIKNEH